MQKRGLGILVTVCGVLLVIAVCFEAYRRAEHYGSRVVESHPVDARIEISNPPAWLDRQIVSNLLDEAYQFAQKDMATYNRARNILDGGILREIADVYTGAEVLNGQSINAQAKGFNAWIKSITEVRRDVTKDKSLQTIRIFAQWREPAVWIRAGDTLYLLDAEGTRLPGDYPLADRARSRLMMLTGVELPVVGDKRGVPPPGERWLTLGEQRLGEDLTAGFKLAEMLSRQKYAEQINAIDMTNFAGRKDARAPWIVLNTIWQTADGMPRVVQWGRPIGEEKYYEVQAAAKLKMLNLIYSRFNRIDAGRDYVDIRTEVVRVPRQSEAAVVGRALAAKE